MKITEIRLAAGVIERHRVCRALLPSLVIASIVLVGCSAPSPSAQSPATPSTTRPAPPSSSTVIPSPSTGTAKRGPASASPGRASTQANKETGDPTPVECAVTAAEIATFRRDWDRVVGSVGRADHTAYTAPLVTEVDALVDKAQGCPGSDNLEPMKAAIDKIDAAAVKDQPDYDAIGAFAKAGNAWLEELGYGTGVLATS